MQANSSTQPPVKSPDVLSTAKRRIYSDEFLLTKSRLVLEVRDGLALPIANLTNPIFGRFSKNNKANYNLRLISAILILGIIFVIGSVITQEPDTIIKAEFWVWCCIFIDSLIYTIAAARALNIFDRFCFDQFTEDNLKDFKHLIQVFYKPKNKLVISLIFSISMLIFLIPSFLITTGKVTFVSYIAAFFVTGIIGSWLHGVYTIRLYTEFLDNKTLDLELYPINPVESVLIKKSESVIQIAAIAVALILTTFIPLTLIVTGPTPLYQYSGIGLLISILLIVAAIFFDGHAKMTNVIATRKHLLLNSIQYEINNLIQTADLNDESVSKRLDFLISLHDRISQTPDQTINPRNLAQTFSSVIIPAGTFLFGHSDVIKNLFFP